MTELENYYNNAIFLNEKMSPLSKFDRSVENGTRYLVAKYINATDFVMELGARYGTVSVYLNKILNNPETQQLAIEPDEKVINCLTYNKTANNCKFNIYNGTISNDDLYVVYNGCGWETKTYKIPPPNLETKKCNVMSLNEAQQKYNIKFNVLIADCEGFLLDFMKENIDFIKQLDTIIYEEDCIKNHPINGIYIDYDEVTKILLSNNFVLLETFIDHIGLANKCWKKAN